MLLSADFGSGFVTLPTAAQISGNTFSFNGVSVTVPASGTVSLRISNIRAAVSQLGASTNNQVRAQIAWIGVQLPLNQSALTVGLTTTGLFGTMYNHGSITCAGSPAPDGPPFTVSGLFAAGTFSATTRLTEGYAGAFQTRGAGEDNGTRFLLTFTGLPAGSRVFVPDYVAGNSAATPTANGDMGVARSGGVYVPGSSTLLLQRVPNADSAGAGAGNTVAAPIGSGPIALNSASEVTVGANGAGYIVYEVVDAHPNFQESVQIPVFVAVPSYSAPGTATETVSFAPVSNVQNASTTAPIPRFIARPVVDDCSLVGDCGAAYYPRLETYSSGTALTGVAGGQMTSNSAFIGVNNSGGGILTWTSTLQYVDGSGWGFLDHDSGVNNATVRVTADPKNLAAGTYRANVIIDAGVAGKATIPVTLTVAPAPPPPTPPAGGGTGTGTGSGGSGTGGSGNPPVGPAVTVSRIVNAATFEPTPLVAGSLGTVFGANFAGTKVSATLDGAPVDILFRNATQINFVTPASARGKNSATLIVTVDGASSAPATVVLAPAWPSIFANGVLNQDNSLNGPEAAAGSGSIIQIYATGIPEGVTVSAQIGDAKDLVPLYAGAAPTVPGVQQVNVAIPAGLDASNAKLVLCAGVGGQQFCSTGYTLAVR